MTRKQLSYLTLAGALLLAFIVHIVDLPEGKSEETIFQQNRNHIIAQYLLLKSSPALDASSLNSVLKSYEKKKIGPGVMEAMILCYGLEGNKAKARQLIRSSGDKESLVYVKYALDLGDSLPHNWADRELKDWVDAKIASMIYQRKGMEVEYVKNQILVHYYEARLERDFRVGSWNMMLCVFGAGLLFSMWLSSRQWRRLGENFFRLLPLPLPFEVLTRFFGFFLLGFMAIGLVVDLTLGSFSSWLGHVVSYLLQMTLGFYLIRRVVFKSNLDTIFEALGLSYMRMRFVVVFQVLGGLAILVFMNAVTGFMEFTLHWPQSNINLSTHFSSLFESPLVAVAFLFVSCILAPVFEEVVFRGLLMRGFMAHVSPSTAICMSSFCFAILHPLANWPSVFLMGVGLGIVYYRTSNLLVNIWAHAAWNGLVIWLSYIGAVY